MEMTINTEASIDMIAEELGREWRQSELDKENSIDGKVRCALLMLKLKEACGTNNNKFSLELMDNDITASKDERAAMIKFARLTERDRNLIASDMKRRGVTSFERLAKDGGLSDMSEDPLPESETVETAQNPQSDEQIAVSEEVKTDRVKSKPSKSFAERERADEVAHVVEKWSQKAKVLGSVHPKAGWSLLLEAMDLGLLSESGASAEKPSARCLFNLPTTRPAGEYLGRYDLSTPKGCKTIAEDLMPFLRRNAEALKTDPMQFMPLWNAEAEAARLERVAKQEAESKAKRMAAMQERGEEELVICGITVWPYPEANIRPFTYEDLRHAFYLFVMAEKMTHIQLVDGVESPSRRSRSINHRHMANEMVKQLGETLGEDSLEKMGMVQTAWHNLSRALENGDLSTAVETKRPGNWNHFKVA